MKIEFTSLHQIDHILNKIEEIDISNQSEDLHDYIVKLLEEITKSDNKRSFEFKSETTEVRIAIEKILNGSYNEGVKINTNRLLDIEIKAQSQIDHLDKMIQKGSFFQALLVDTDEKVIVLTKADHNQFIDEIDFTLKKGLPWDKRIFKAFLVKFDNEHNIKNIYVYDTTNRTARYWWDGYLELKEKYTDSHNTKTSLYILDRKIFDPIKRNYPADHTYLRNSTIRYFRSNDEFVLNDFLEQNFINYIPVDPDFPKEKIVNKIKELPEKWKFDYRFVIKKDEIKKKIINIIPLTEKIDLVFKDFIENINSIIIAWKDAEGNKYLKIKTDEGYNRFNKVNE